MSLFRKFHVVTVPPEFLDEGAPPTQLRFSQLNSGKMARANESDTLKAIERSNTIMSALSEEQRQVSIDRQRTTDAESIKRAEERAEEPDTFDDFDENKLCQLARVEHKQDSKWVELTAEQIDDLVCLEWIAGEIYDVSKPSSANEREGNS